MSRFGDVDGVFSTGESSSGGADATPGTDPSGSEGGPTTAAPTTTEPGTTGTPSTTAATDDGETTPADDSSSSEVGVEESSSGASSDEGGTSSESSSGGETSPLEDVDLSGYTVVQTGSDREFVLPAGTVVPLGGSLVIARNASPGAFQGFWGVNWGDEVVYIDGADQFPTINGGETYSLRAPDDTLVEGPTPTLDLSTVMARTDADADAGDTDAWSVDVAPNDGSTPGSSDAVGGVSGTVYISEYTDPVGAGNFVYEYVEISVVP